MTSKRDELKDHVAKQRGDLVPTAEPDDEAAEAVQNLTADIAIASIERDIRTLAEIESALKRLETGKYGYCEFCAEEIADSRLHALPWARLCLRCAQRGNQIRTAA